MPSSTLTVFKKFLEYEAEGVINLATDQLTVALTNAAPNTSTNTVLADITEVSYANCSSRNLTTSSSGESGGTYILVVADLTLTATGGSVGPFRYLVVYDNTPTSPADPLVGYLDYGSSITIQDGESFDIDAHAVNGILQKTASP